MLELIGLIAIIYLAFKLLPGFLMFLVKLFVAIAMILLFLAVINSLFPIYGVYIIWYFLYQHSTKEIRMETFVN